MNDIKKVQHYRYRTGMFGTGPEEEHWTAVRVGDTSAEGGYCVAPSPAEALAGLGAEEPELCALLERLGEHACVEQYRCGVTGERHWMACYTTPGYTHWCYGDTPVEAVRKALARDHSINPEWIARGVAVIQQQRAKS